MQKIIIFTMAMFLSVTLVAQKQSTDIKPSQLPEVTQNYIKNNLPGCQITNAAKVVDAGKVSYDVTVDVKGKKNLFVFDGAGAFVKRGNPQIDPNKPVLPSDPNQKPVPPEEEIPIQPEDNNVKTVQGKKVAQPVKTTGTDASQKKSTQTSATKQQGTQPSTVPGTTKKIAQPESQGTQTTGQPKSTQQTTPQGVKQTGEKKVAQPVSTGGTKPAAQPASTQPATTGSVKPVSSGAVQPTGSGQVKQTGTTTDKKVAQPAGSTETTKPKK
jgi:hypothetical protein